MSQSDCTVVMAQVNLMVGDLQGNVEQVITATKAAIEQYQPDLVLFPELTLSGYPPEDLLFRPGFYTRCQRAFEQLLKAALPTKIVVGYPARVGDRYFNRAAVIDHGKVIAMSSKQELPNYTVFDEKRYFSPGKAPCVFMVNGLRFGLLICEDLWHRHCFQNLLEHDIDVVLSINASPFDRQKARVREELLVDRATMGKVPILYLNLVAGQDELVFDGGSMVVNRLGERVIQAPYYEPALVPVQLSRSATGVQVTPQSLPPRLLSEENLYRALMLGVRDYTHKNGFPSAVIGLSGGIDSALTLAIAVDALGADCVRAVMMPTQYTSAMSLEDAAAEAMALGVQYDVVDIEPIYQAYLETVKPLFADRPVDTAEENIQSRIRGNILMALSNKFGSIVLTTGNKSELSVGYSTLYGDMAGGFCVLKDVPKTLVYQLATYRNRQSVVIPDRVMTRPPSAELAPNQLDQDSLPPYDILDDILHRYVECDEDPARIYSERLPKTIVDQVVRLVNHNEYKRRQSPIGIRTTQRAFGKDRRYPITSGYSRNIDMKEGE